MENRLKELREYKQLQQKQVAEQLNVSPSTYWYWEKGISEPDFESLNKLANFYNVSLDYLLRKDTSTNDFNPNKITILGYGIGKKEIELTEEQKQLLTSLIDQFEKSNKK